MQRRIWEIDFGYLGKIFVEIAIVLTPMFRLVEEIPKSKYKCQNCVRASHYILPDLGQLMKKSIAIALSINCPKKYCNSIKH